jgi:type I restriction enzyme S subunit
MSADWKNVRLAEIAAPVSRLIPVVAGTHYRTIGVKWWGEGAYERQTIDGSQTVVENLSLVRQDDLIINKIWVRQFARERQVFSPIEWH